MKSILSFGAVICLVLVCAQSIDAQVQMVTRVEGDGAFHLKEVQVFLTSSNDTVKVLMVLPKKLRPEGYADIEIEKDDEILMFNARRVKSVQGFEEMYNRLNVGDDVKLGLRRDGRLLIQSFKKIDPADLPQGTNVRIRLDASGDGDGESPVMTRTLRVGEGNVNLRPWFGTGLMLGTSDGKITVMRILEGMTSALADADIRKGDVIESLNGNPVKSLEQFFERYEQLPVGSKVDVGYTRDGKKLHLSFEKPAVRGKVMIRPKN